MRTILEKQTFTGRRNSFDADSALILDCSFTDCLMQGATFSDGVLVRCAFKDVSLYWAHMFRTVFVDCSFDGVEFRGANMEESMFVRCALTRCDFSRDNLGGETNLSAVGFVDSARTDCRV
jgi:uncharacterized protein YjbI with pentapeptide repeats